MRIDITSMIIGGVLWELLSAYIHFVIKPYIKKREYDKANGDKSKQDSKDNKKNKIGYTAD